MEFVRPRTWADALAAKAAYPDGVPIQGGTDVIVELNFDRHRPAALIDLTGVQELAEWSTGNGHVRLGANVTYTRVIAVTAFGLALHPERRAVGTGLGSAAPTPRRADEAERFVAAALDEAGLWESRGPLPETVAQRFGDLVADAAAPIDDVRGTARYRVHALSVLARRALGWAWADYQCGRK